MRLDRDRLLRILSRNTRVAARLTGDGKPLSPRVLIRWHWLCGGMWDHLLACWLAGPTLTLSAWLWQRSLGCCAYAGFLGENPVRVGCLIHPLRIGGNRDWRRWAFPLVPTLRCDRDLRCGILCAPASPEETTWDWYAASRRAAATRKTGRHEHGAESNAI